LAWNRTAARSATGAADRMMAGDRFLPALEQCSNNRGARIARQAQARCATAAHQTAVRAAERAIATIMFSG
jgi:hypothetical protein